MTDWKPDLTISTAAEATVWSLFQSRARAHPDLPAVADGTREISYGELLNRVRKLARLFLDQGLQPGDRVALLARNCIEYLEIELACAATGTILAALNWRLARREMRHCIELVSPAMVIVQPDLEDVLADHEFAKTTRLRLGDNYEESLGRTGQLQEADLPAVDPEDGLVILYTSGTTGMPKGALISHRAMIARAMLFVAELGLPLDSHFVAWAPLYHMASTDHSLAMLMRGSTVHVVDGYDEERLIDLVSSVKIGWLVLMPGMVGEFAAAFAESGKAAQGIVCCGAMADLVPREQIAAATRALDAPYMNSFGATETGLAPATGLIPIGEAPTDLRKRQAAFCDLRLVDPDDREVSSGQPGEISLRGPTLFSGYWNADETNAHDFRGGRFHMGDVMRRNADGTLDYVDRVKYMIKSGGENIYPAEIEQVVLRDERVSEAICVRQKDERWGEVPVLFVVRADVALTKEEVMQACTEDLSSYKRPKDVIFISDDELPRSTTGKIQRHELERRL